MIRIFSFLLLALLPILGQHPLPKPPSGSPQEAKPTNRLAKEQSPYLRQHRHNPVEWYPWGKEAFEAAKKHNKPIFLSIGYAACHWCHVMERESFEDREVADYLNAHFISIKVDREERPDVDQIYMDACRYYQNGRGGWPLSALLTPDRLPFFAGTYYPKKHFLVLLERTVELWGTKREALVKDATAIRGIIAEMNALRKGEKLPNDLIKRASEHLIASEDSRFGGFGGAPKFPRVSAPLLLLRARSRKPDPRIDAAMNRMLDAMAKGGLHDHLEGGFHRYSVDQRWFVPHFEKMLYDQALMAQLYLEAGVALGQERHLAIARKTLDQILSVFRLEDGSFIASLDADTEGVEGKTYTWTLDEVRKLLTPEEARVIEAWSLIEKEGNWEHGRNILHEAQPAAEVAISLKLAPARVDEVLASAQAKLLSVRATRPQPGRDIKVLCAWNALAIASLAQAAPVLGPRYLEAAEAAMATIDRHLLQKNGRYLRSRAAGVSRHPGTLQDHAAVLRAKLELYRQTLNDRYLEAAHGLAQVIFEDYGQDGGLVDSKATDLITQTRNLHDGALPSGISLALEGWIRLGQVMQEGVWEARAKKALLSAMGRYDAQPGGSPHALIALDLLQGGKVHVTLAGEKLPETWLKFLRSGYRPDLRLLRTAREGFSSALVCVDQTCFEATVDFETLKKQIARPAAAILPLPEKK